MTSIEGQVKCRSGFSFRVQPSNVFYICNVTKRVIKFNYKSGVKLLSILTRSLTSSRICRKAKKKNRVQKSSWKSVVIRHSDPWLRSKIDRTTDV